MPWVKATRQKFWKQKNRLSTKSNFEKNNQKKQLNRCRGRQYGESSGKSPSKARNACIALAALPVLTAKFGRCLSLIHTEAHTHTHTHTHIHISVHCSGCPACVDLFIYSFICLFVICRLMYLWLLCLC